MRVLPLGETARMLAVRNTNLVELSVHPVEGTERVVLVSALDNLVKGGAGQAVQNLNVMLGLSETTGLPGACAGGPH